MKKAKSDISAAIYETIEDMHSSGAVDKETMRHFASRCLVPDVPDYSPTDIVALRTKLNVSQGVLATVLNASTGTVQQWEQGIKRPSGIARKLLNVLDRKGMNALL